MKTLLIYTFSVLIILLGGCNKDKIPGVYRIDIQQGNAVNQEMINKLKPDMTKNQVAYVLGTPLIIDTFHPNRWDYIYSFHPGNGQREQRSLTVYFNDDEKLSHLEGDTRTVAREDLPQAENKETNVVVPLSDKKTGLFQGLLNSVGLGEDEIDTIPSDEEITQSEPIREQLAEEADEDPAEEEINVESDSE